MVPGRATCGYCGVEQLLAGRGIRQADAERARSLQREVQVLLVKRNTEARLEIALDHAFAVDLENAGSGKSAHQRLTDASRIGTGLGSEHQRLADRLDRQSDDYLICDLGRLSVAIAADKRDVLAHEREDWLDLLERALRAPDHDREARRLRADFAAGNRRIEIFAAQIVDLLGEVLRGDGGDRTHVDDNLALCTPFHDAS